MNRAHHVEEALKGVRQITLDEGAWEREWFTIERLGSLLGFRLGEGMTVLDVGCGNRELSAGAARRGIRYVGIDISDGDFEHSPFPVKSKSVDMVVALAFIEHLHNPDNFLRETKRVLRPGGLLFLSTPNWKYSWRYFFDNPAHVHPYTPKALGALADAYDLGDVRLFPGLRVKPLWMYESPFAFQLARLIPTRRPLKGLFSFLGGKASSIFLVARSR